MFQKSVKRGRSFKRKEQDIDSLNIKVKQRSKSQYDQRKKSSRKQIQINNRTKNRTNFDSFQLKSTEDQTLARNAGKIRNVLANKFIQTFNKLK